MPNRICKIILVAALAIPACTTKSSGSLKEAEWSCANQQLQSYEHRTKEEYIKVRCKK